jgi:hypothetical protein
MSQTCRVRHQINFRNSAFRWLSLQVPAVCCMTAAPAVCYMIAAPAVCCMIAAAAVCYMIAAPAVCCMIAASATSNKRSSKPSGSLGCGRRWHFRKPALSTDQFKLKAISQC